MDFFETRLKKIFIFLFYYFIFIFIVDNFMTFLKNQNKLFYTGIGLCLLPCYLSIIKMVNCKTCKSMSENLKQHMFPFVCLNDEYFFFV